MAIGTNGDFVPNLSRRSVSVQRQIRGAHFLPAFGDQPLERITGETIERWLAAQLREGELSRRSLQKMVVLLNGIFRRARKVWKLPQNPVADIERLAVAKRTDIEFYSPEEVHALVRASGDEQDGALRFHDLRHTFGSVAIRTADPRELQEWMGHSDFSTTQIYMHRRPRADAARRLSAAFGSEAEQMVGETA